MPVFAAMTAIPTAFELNAVIAGTVSQPLAIPRKHGDGDGGRRIVWNARWGASPATLDLRLQGLATGDPATMGTTNWFDIDTINTVADQSKHIDIPKHALWLRVNIVAITGVPAGPNISVTV